MTKLKSADQTALRTHARAIRELGKRIHNDGIEIGRHLIDAKRVAGHGHFAAWLKREFSMSERTAQNLMRIAEAAAKFAEFADLGLPMRTMALLAAKSTPEPVRQEAIDRKARGEDASHRQIRGLIAAKTQADAEPPKAGGMLIAAQSAAASPQPKGILRTKETAASVPPQQRLITGAPLPPPEPKTISAIDIARELDDLLRAVKRFQSYPVGVVADAIPPESWNDISARSERAVEGFQALINLLTIMIRSRGDDEATRH